MVAMIPIGNSFIASATAASDPDASGLISGMIVAITTPLAMRVANVIAICFFILFLGGVFAELLFDNKHPK